MIGSEISPSNVRRTGVCIVILQSYNVLLSFYLKKVSYNTVYSGLCEC